MAVRMSHPTPHPKTGFYAARVAIPKHLQTITVRRHGARSEFRENLKTRDKVEAVRLSRPVFERFDGWLRAAEAEHSGTQDRLTDHEVSVLCGRWLAQREAQTLHNLTMSSEQHDEAASYYADVVRDAEEGVLVIKAMEAEVTPLLADAGRVVDRDSLQRISARLAGVAVDWHRSQVEWATTGRRKAAVTSQDFPKDHPTPAPGASLTMDALLAGWAADRGWKLDAKLMPRALYDRVRTLERLATFLGHRDAARVVKADAVRWKAEMQGRDLSAATIRNDLSEMSAVWKSGVLNGHLDANPFAGVSPPKPKRRKREVRAFTDEEARRVLEAARKETGALRWLSWVCCLTGARLGEIVQSNKEDVVEVQGVMALRIHAEGDEGRSLKNDDSRRTVPLHPALIAEGFVDYVAGLPKGSPLFPDIEPDRQFGRRAVTASKRIGRWLREVVGITDERISPSHSWRHWFIDAARAVVMPAEIRSAITGHSGKMDESSGYGEGMRGLVVVMGEHLGRVSVPVRR